MQNKSISDRKFYSRQETTAKFCHTNNKPHIATTFSNTSLDLVKAATRQGPRGGGVIFFKSWPPAPYGSRVWTACGSWARRWRTTRTGRWAPGPPRRPARCGRRTWWAGPRRSSARRSSSPLELQVTWFSILSSRYESGSRRSRRRITMCRKHTCKSTWLPSPRPQRSPIHTQCSWYSLPP